MEKDKELLLKDLCARLLYGVKVVRYVERDNKVEQLIPEMDLSLRLFELSISNQWFIIKPYLRPMSSMTEEERKEYNDIVKNIIDFIDCPKSDDVCFPIILIDWLNAHHFDYRGLISMGLALEAPKGMYKID
jgi:hypothetical protein